jgi:signal peptidase II
LRRLALIAGVIAFADQLTKWLVLRAIHPDQPVEVIDGCFRLVSWTNTGAAWGILQNSNLLLAAISVLAIAGILLFRQHFQIERPGNSIALGLITGGIIGNVIDRFYHGHVIDFLDFSFRGHHWPAFNVADSAICCGVALYLILSYRTQSA